MVAGSVSSDDIFDLVGQEEKCYRTTPAAGLSRSASTAAVDLNIK